MEFSAYNYTSDNINSRLSEIFARQNAEISEIDVCKDILSFIDLTTLEGSDTQEKVISLCNKAKGFKDTVMNIPEVAAVCVYPNFIKLVKQQLIGSHIKAASVAGAFPAGQTPLHLKVEEVKYAINQGADEIDMVISRGKFLEGNYNEVYDEIASIREACNKTHLKVILETGELASIENIRKASELAINAGADFIKTSTGKIQPAATEEATLIIADTIKESYLKTGKRIGIKPAGGISTHDQAIRYYLIIWETLGEAWLSKDLFRIGASKLADEVYSRIIA